MKKLFYFVPILILFLFSTFLITYLYQPQFFEKQELTLIEIKNRNKTQILRSIVHQSEPTEKHKNNSNQILRSFLYPNSSLIQKDDRIGLITMKQIADYHCGFFSVPDGYTVPTKINPEVAKTIKYKFFQINFFFFFFFKLIKLQKINKINKKMN